MTNDEAARIIGQYDVNFYWTDGEPIPAQDLTDAFEMAITALKEREPKLLDLFHQAVYLPVLWFECRGYPPFPAKVGVFSQVGDIVEIQMFARAEGRLYSANDYGAKWRCWSSCPTDEQMEGTPWKVTVDAE